MRKKKTEASPQGERLPEVLPVLPLRDEVIYPHMVVPLVAGRPGTIQAVEEAFREERLILLITQRDSQVEEVDAGVMYRVGVLARIGQVIRLPNSLMRVLVEGIMRIKVERFFKRGLALYARYRPLVQDEPVTPEVEAASRKVVELFREFVSLSRHIPDEVGGAAAEIQNPRRLADFVAIHLNRPTAVKQHLLEMDSVSKLLIILAQELNREIEILRIEQSIEGKVKERISRSQRTYYLQEQLKAIKKELGEDLGEDFADVIEFRRKVRKLKLPKEVRQKAEEEIKRLENTPMLSPEATVIRTYLEWLLGVPWGVSTSDNTDIQRARQILDEDHYGLEKVKERILEHLAVMVKSEGRIRGPILCFVGPPGVGKTSLGRSIARALGRKFVRVSLGGVRDEAEIRGHRRTYIGALPGRIIQSMKRAGTINPVFLMDEVDKMSIDFRGDPTAALLEVLDPEQNYAFNDHYLEVDYDLSKVLFITTANTREGIPWPLRDRMEVIELPGYLHQEKFQIARQFLIPKQMKECGIEENEVIFTDGAIHTIIDRYTREAGVRELERSIAKIFRKAARMIMEGSKKPPIKVDGKLAMKMLGVPPYEKYRVDGKSRVGAAIGLAWTPFGGDVMFVEAETMRGRGNLVLTGQLGEVMQESARAALTAVRARAESLGFDGDSFLKQEIHVHVPEGAVPKDGPSAGITIAVAIASAILKRPVRGNIAMTGEITLRGEILPVGGIREKLMAALRAGISTVIIPERNRPELAEVPLAVKKPLHIIPVKSIDEVFNLAFLPETERPPKEEPVTDQVSAPLTPVVN